ncbi:hypothetical protein DRQ36_03745 [bacterium]|nr:MAG: hypothetical protein DRQ36_03745 [bacterium]
MGITIVAEGPGGAAGEFEKVIVNPIKTEDIIYLSLRIIPPDARILTRLIYLFNMVFKNEMSSTSGKP